VQSHSSLIQSRTDGLIHQGCIISQQNPHLIASLSLLTSHHVNGISSLYLSSLLTWSQLPTLLKLNSERLTASYCLLAAFLTNRNIEYVAPSHGLFLFARLVRHAKNAGDEKCFLDRLAIQGGIKVGHGRFYKGVEEQFGWARIRFSVKREEMLEALGRMDKVLRERG
jgi:DNA-binding transcriptional MocR family regulator